MHGGRFGHSEWVTSVCFLGDGSGSIVSAGMDGKVCVWDARATGRHVACADLLGHFGSVSAVASPGGGTAACGLPSAVFGGLIVSAGYDKSVRLWRGDSGAALAQLKGHGAPVLNLALLAKDGAGELLAASGDRDGIICAWRLHEGSAATALRGHKGHLTALAWMAADVAGAGAGGSAGAAGAAGTDLSAGGPFGGADLLVSGAQDGRVRVWDLRAAAAVANIGCHASAEGAGAIGDISVTSPSGADTVVVTAGADRRVCVLDPRAGFLPRSTFSEHRDFIYSLTTAGRLSFSGGGDGTVIAHDLLEGRALWALGAGLAAIRGLAVAGGSHLVATGDDGKCVSYTF
jgi:hypothetical protein